VISGFNTDIEFEDRVYHVQTEDKGHPARMIMSLVYDGGTILASKRASYEDLAAVNFDEKEVSERLSRQHKLICAAVKAGRLDELKKMAAKGEAGATRQAPLVTAIVEAVPEPLPVAAAVTAVSTPIARVDPMIPSAPLKIAMVETEQILRVIPADPLDEELVLEAIDIIEDEILPSEAVAVVSELSGQERTPNSKLSLELLGDGKFKGGDRRMINIMICRGTERKVVTDAQIMIKVLGSSFRPVIFHAKTDANGIARVHLQLPHFQAGRAALLIRAMTGGEEIELRRVVTPG